MRIFLLFPFIIFCSDFFTRGRQDENLFFLFFAWRIFEYLGKTDKIYTLHFSTLTINIRIVDKCFVNWRFCQEGVFKTVYGAVP